MKHFASLVAQNFSIVFVSCKEKEHYRVAFGKESLFLTTSRTAGDPTHIKGLCCVLVWLVPISLALLS